jgi:uncharacterized protein YtpQ (UPF0354 family)
MRRVPRPAATATWPALLCALTLLLALLAPVTASAQKLQSPEQFTRTFHAALVKAAPDSGAAIAGPLEVRYTIGDSDRTSFLDNAYDEYRQAPDQGGAIIAHYVASAMESTGPTELSPDAAGRLMPVVRPREYVEAMNELARSQDTEGAPSLLLAEPLNEILVALYVIDTPTSMRFVNEDGLEELGLERSEVRARAAENLKGHLPELTVHTGEALFMVIADGNYESSLLLLDHLWEPGKLPFEGDPIVAVPTRDVLLVTGTEMEGGAARVREIAASLTADGSRVISSELFIRRDGAWVLLKP